MSKHIGNSSNANSLINEAFNINSSFNSMQPMIVLPPTSTHSQPIHRRTPSTEIKKADPTSLLDRTSAMASHNQTLPKSGIFSTSSFFDQPNLNATTAGISLFHSSVTEPNSSSLNSSFSSEINKEINSNNSSKPPSASQTPNIKPPISSSLTSSSTKNEMNNLSNLPQLTTPAANLFNLPALPALPGIPVIPPLNIPHVPPPMQIPSLSTAGANPYSAKGALNKKVFDTNIVPTTFSAGAPALASQTFQLSQPTVASNMFVPPPIATNSLTPSTSSISLSSQVINNFQSPPPPPSPAFMNFNPQAKSSKILAASPHSMSNNLTSTASFSIIPPPNYTTDDGNKQQIVDPSA